MATSRESASDYENSNDPSDYTACDSEFLAIKSEWPVIKSEFSKSSLSIGASDDVDGCGAAWLSVWGQVVDREVDDCPAQFHFNARPGPPDVPGADAAPVEYFLTLLGDAFVDNLVQATNQYGDDRVRQLAGSVRGLPSNSRFHKWRHTTVAEMRAFLALTINMGLIRKSTIPSYWDDKYYSQSTPMFSRTFTKDRFLLLLSTFHWREDGMESPGERSTAKWTKRVSFALLGRALLNSFILYQQRTCHQPKLDRRTFQVHIVEGLIGTFREPRVRAGGPGVCPIEARLTDPVDHLKPEKLPNGKRRDCVVCTDRNSGKRVRTSYLCATCNVALCIGQCWKDYHTRVVYKT
uniref:uncharacterized protein n=1 Tax=Myxine glutinosa TaxID=7769 RepID=UPI00358E4AC7